MIRYCLFILLIILNYTKATAQNGDDSLINASNYLQPGSSTTLSFKIENKSTIPQTYVLTAQTPNALIVPLIPQREITVASFDSMFYIVPLRLSPEAGGGKQNIVLHVIEQNGGTEYHLSKTIYIATHSKIEVMSMGNTEYLRAGDTIHAQFIVKNTGNTKELLRLESNMTGFKNGSTLELEPGGVQLINGYKKTDPGIVANQYFSVTLSATPLNSTTTTNTVTGYNSVSVIATKQEKNDLYFRLPVTASLSYLRSRMVDVTQSGYQFNIEGKGSLNSSNKHFIEFKAVTPSPVALNSFTHYDEYFINYKNDHLFVHIGNKTYTSSFLTEMSRYGRGAELRYDFKKIALGAFYNSPRFFKDIKSETNVYVSYKVKEKSEITLGYLHKMPNQLPDMLGYASPYYLKSQARLPYLKSNILINKNVTIGGELAYSQTDTASGMAGMLQAQAYYPKWNANLMYLTASPHFAGYFNNSNAFNGNASYRILKNLSAYTYLSKDARNINRDTLFLSAPIRMNFQYGIQYQYAKSGTLGLFNGWNKNEDRRFLQQFNYNERYYRLSLNQQFWIINMRLEGQWGTTENKLSNYTGKSNYYTLNLSATKFNTTLNLYASIGQTSRYNEAKQKQLYYGFNLMSRIANKTNLSLFYQNNYAPEEYYRDRNLFEGVLSQQLFRNHEINFSGRYTLQRGTSTKDFIVALRYVVRLNVPVQRVAKYSSLSGNIANWGVQNTEGLKLKLGNHETLTDKEGNYTIKNIVPGDYILELDRSSTDANAIPNVNMPLALHLAESDTIFNFALSAAATIKGKVELTETGNTSDSLLAKIPTVPGNNNSNSIIIEASNGKQTYRKICNLGGEFDFTYLRPGEWTVKTYRNGLDKKYKIADDEFHLELKVNETLNLTISVVRQQKQIQYQQESIKVVYNQKN